MCVYCTGNITSSCSTYKTAIDLRLKSEENVNELCCEYEVYQLRSQQRRSLLSEIECGTLTLLPTVTDIDATHQVQFFTIIAGRRRHICRKETNSRILSVRDIIPQICSSSIDDTSYRTRESLIITESGLLVTDKVDSYALNYWMYY